MDEETCPPFFIVNKQTQRCIIFGVTLRFKQSNVKYIWNLHKKTKTQSFIRSNVA